MGTVSRYKVTVRGTDIELRGYVDGDATLRLTAKSLEGLGLVIASPAPAGFNPFAITEPDYPPTLENSIDVLTGIGATADGIVDLIEKFAALHFAQAIVIRNERYLREQAEAELRDRELHHFETEQMVAGASAVADALSDNWEQGDLAGAVSEAIGFLRGMTTDHTDGSVTRD
jgi:hypothetical protein